jgi:hypothetical protein
MSSKKKLSNKVFTTEEALAVMRDYFLSDGSMTDEQKNRVMPAKRKLLVDTAKFWGSANSEQQHQLTKLRRFFDRAIYGPALSVSRRRLRAALFLKEWWTWKAHGKMKNRQMRIRDALSYIQLLRPMREALYCNDDDFFEDLAIAIRFAREERVDEALAIYSFLCTGKAPFLTFRELQQFLGMEAADLRKKIKRLRKEYGEFVVPLKRGQLGRPPKK